MAIKSIQVGQAGLSNTLLPTWVYIDTNDTIATVTTAGYLNGVASEYINTLTNRMMALVITRASAGLGVPPVLYILQVQNNAGVWTLASPAVDVPVPFIVGGNIQAGSSGVAGDFISFSSTAAKGSLIFKAVANTGNTNTTVSNAAMGQASVISIPDPGAATANFLLNSGAQAMAAGSSIALDKGTGTESSHAVTINKQAGVITTTSLTTAQYASETITLTNSEIATTSVVIASIMGGTNTTEGVTVSATAGSGTSTIVLTNTNTAALNGTVIVGFAVF